MRKRLSILLLLAVGMTMMFGGSVFAFADIHGDKGESAIIALKEAGVISGLTAEKFAPRGKVTYAQGIQMLVKGFDLNTDHIRFAKEPKASDFFTNVPDDAWYAESFVVAHLNGLPIPKEVDPKQNLSKEQFAHLLFKAILTKGDFAFIEMYVMLKDEREVTTDLMDSIQSLLVSNIAELDNGYFYPKKEITRSEAAQLLHKAIRFVKKVKPLPPAEPPVDTDVTMTVSKVNDEVNKVTVSWGEKPNPGYRVSISSIEFTSNGEANIYYELHEPDKDKMYPQVITEAKTDTFISSEYQPVLKKGAAGADSFGGNADGGGLNPNAPVHN